MESTEFSVLHPGGVSKLQYELITISSLIWLSVWSFLIAYLVNLCWYLARVKGCSSNASVGLPHPVEYNTMFVCPREYLS